MNFSSFQLYRILGAAFLVLQIFTFARAEDLEVEIVLDKTAKKAMVRGGFADDTGISNRRNVAFARAVIGDAALGKRISVLKLFDRSGSPLDHRKLMDGEYLAAADFARWSYEVDLAVPANQSAYAHRSWIDEDAALLMLDDLLPRFVNTRGAVSAHARLSVPEGWRLLTSSPKAADGAYEIRDVMDGVFVLGSALRIVEGSAKGGPPIAITGDRPFTDLQARDMTDEIFGAYLKIFGDRPRGKPLVVLMKFPPDISPGAWEAETRGDTVIVMSSDMPFASQALQRLHEQLRHELFHLWVPNSLQLTGNYGWFYEGFALYQSLKTGVDSNRIRFEDFLDTLSRAYAIDVRQRPRKPLVGLENAVGARVNTELYARGMLIAFLTDIRLLDGSNRRRDMSDVLKELFARHGPTAEGLDANKAISAIMGETLISRYVTGTEPIDWSAELKMAGLIVSSERSGALAVSGKLSGEQKRLLDRLGYNNWRRSPRRIKK